MNRLLHAVCLALVPASIAQAQEFHNIVNAPFNTVSSGPMQASIVDVADTTDVAGVRRAVATRVNATRQAQQRILARELDLLRKAYPNARHITLGIPDIVMLRDAGRHIVLPAARRGRAGNQIDFSFPAQGTSGSWDPRLQADMINIHDVVDHEMRSVYGNPSWNGTINVINGENLPAGQLISQPNTFWGGVYNISSNELIFTGQSALQTFVLNLSQALAMAYRGPSSISYDVWERGMARAAAQVAVRRAIPALKLVGSQAFGGTLGDIDLSDPFFNGLDRYDLLNQPALGSDRFFPLSRVNGVANTSSFPLMMYSRLQMCGTAWVKLATTDPTFFATFNGLYYTALQADPTVANSVPKLRDLAGQAFSADMGAGATIESLVFQDWFQRQFAFDTSISQGAKMFVEPIALRPDETQASPLNDDYGFTFIVRYFQTAYDGTNSDELSLNGTCYPVYSWFSADLATQNRLFLGAQYEQFAIGGDITGLGTVSPSFFNTLGGDPTLQSRLRIAVDLPVNSVTQRLYVAPRSMGTLQRPNNFWGAVVGADSGTITLTVEGTAGPAVAVQQGCFGAALDASMFTRPGRGTIVFTPTGGAPITRNIVVGYSGVAVVVYAGDPVSTRSHQFADSPSMVSFPIRPLQPRAADALLDATGKPLFGDGNLLMARWQQNLSSSDKYIRYPSMEPLAPGNGYWQAFPAPTTVNLVGYVAASDPFYSTSLIAGWNQIGNPYELSIDPDNLQFQYLADNTSVPLQTAISKGWIDAVTVPGVGQVVLYDFTSASGYVRAASVDPWKGYFIKVKVSEGLTLTFVQPTRAATITRAGAPAKTSGWSLPLELHGPSGTGATAYIGQADKATGAYDPTLDTIAPPAFSRSVPGIALTHADWGSDSGDYFTDIRRTNSGATWNVTVYAPTIGQQYTLTWSRLNQVPRSVRLVLIDQATGTRQYLNASSGYSFTPSDSPTRRFRIVAENRSSTALRLLRMAAQVSRATGSRAVTIAYDLSQGATVSAQIRSPNGAVLRRIVQGRAANTGTNTLSWDTRNDAGVSVPSGVYLAEVTAVSADGEVARMAQPFTIVR